MLLSYLPYLDGMRPPTIEPLPVPPPPPPYDHQVVSDPEDVYCVILHALTPDRGEAHVGTVGASSSREERQQPTGGMSSPSETPGEEGTGHSRMTLFSGYVSYGQVSEHIRQSGQLLPRSLPPWFRGLMGQGRAVNGREKILMAGPGGVGQAEVAVQKQLLPQRMEDGAEGGAGGAGGTSGEVERRPGLLRSIMSSVASLLRDDEEEEKEEGVPPAGSDQRAHSGSDQQQQQPDQLQCALMSLWLPVDMIARNILRV